MKVITIFDWLDFKEVGDDLSKSSEESYVRGAITMYYYAVFSAIRDYLINVKHQFQFNDRRKIHKRLWEFLLDSSNDNANEIGNFLFKVRSVRNHANYDSQYDLEYFLEELKNIRINIENVVSSVEYLRTHPYVRL